MPRSANYQTLRRLAYFAAIADAGSIRGAAAQLGLSVPVVSTALAELEQELQIALAVRSTRRLELTAAGDEIYSLARRMLDAADQALNYCVVERPLNGRLAVSLPVELAAHWLPERLAGFAELHPEIVLHVDASDTLVDLSQSQIDLAIRATYQQPSLNAESQPGLARIELQCVAKTSPRLNWQDDTALVDATLLALSGSGTTLHAVDRSARRPVQLQAKATITTNNHETAIAMARQGLGFVLVLAESVKADLAAQRLVAVAPRLSFGSLALEVVLRDSLPSPQARAFAKFLQSYP